IVARMMPDLPGSRLARAVRPTHSRHDATHHPAQTYAQPSGGNMKLVRFGAPGREKPGIIDKNGKIRDLSKVVPDIAGDALSPKGLARIKKADLSKLPAVKAGTRLGPCVAGTRHFIAIGLNYADHAAETGAQIPKEPIIFQKAPNSI